MVAMGQENTNRENEPLRHEQQLFPEQSGPSIPDGGYGWVITACVGMTNGHSWGINSAYSVFLAHYLSNDVFEGATPMQYALVGTLGVGCTLAVAPIATVAVRRFGTRPTMLCGTIFQSVSLACSSLTTSIWQLFLTQGVLFGLGMGLIYIPASGIIPQWFDKHRSLASGYTIAGAGLGGLVYSLASGAMIENLSVEWAFRILSIVSLVVNTTCVLLIRTRYDEVGSRQLAFDMALLKRVEYLLVLGFGSFSMLGYFVLIFTLANYAKTMGFNPSQASLIPALLMLGQAIGRPIIGWFSDRCGAINIVAMCTLATGVLSLTVWVNAKLYGVLIFFALVEGLVAGSFWVGIAPVLAEVVGLENLPAGLSLLWVSVVPATVASEPIALEIVDRTGSYIGAQLFTGFSFIVAGLCLGLLRGWIIGGMAAKSDGDSGGAERTITRSTLPTRYAMFIRHCFTWKNL